VSEIENRFMRPSIGRVILEHEGFTGAALQPRLDAIAQDMFALLAKPAALEAVVLRHCRRRIDRALKTLDLSSAVDEAGLAADLAKSIAALDVRKIGQTRRSRIQDAVRNATCPRSSRCLATKEFFPWRHRDLRGRR
jgi:hypothetical protein